MSTSASPMLASRPPTTQMILHVSLKMAQLTSMAVPPLYLISSLVLRRGRPFSVNQLMRVSIGSVLLASGVGAAMGWGRLRNEPSGAIVDRVERMKVNAGQIRTDDYSLIGAALTGIAVPALLLRRAPLPSLVLGGASIGLGVGVWTHLVQALGGGEDVRPEGMVGEVPIVGGNEKK